MLTNAFFKANLLNNNELVLNSKFVLSEKSKMRKIYIALIILLLLFQVNNVSALEIEWKLYLKPTVKSGPFITATTREGEPFTINRSYITGNISGSEEIVNALDGASFLLQKCPLNNSISIHVIFNVNGNNFESIMGVNLCMNAKIETYVGGIKETRADLFNNSPIILTLPSGSGLDYLLDKSGSQRNETIFVYYPGGKFDKDGINTSSQVIGLVTYIRYQYVIVGGKSRDLGFPSNVNTSTWSTIKKLFE